MSALLAAKGIASEAALINLGNAYALPDPPTLTVLNHVIVYLPDFDLYDDPTASGAAFGVLAPEAYDKPVVRVSASAATLARTPAMRPQDHTSHSRTVLHVAADGSVTGETHESATGALAVALRGAAAAVQNLGSEAAARRVLQGFGTPGTGSFDLSHVAEPIDPADVQGTFVLDTKFRPPRLPGRAGVPFGMPLLTRPGNFLLPPRLSGRASAFVCYAGEQTEDIEATFADGFPMPVAPPALRIDKPLLAYHSSFKVEGRTLKIHQEYASSNRPILLRASRGADREANMNLVWIHTHGGFAFAWPGHSPAASAPKPAQPVELVRAVAAEQKLRLDFFYWINPDCSSIGVSTVRIIEPPKNGRLTVENSTGFTRLPGERALRVQQAPLGGSGSAFSAQPRFYRHQFPYRRRGISLWQLIEAALCDRGEIGRGTIFAHLDVKHLYLNRITIIGNPHDTPEILSSGSSSLRKASSKY